MNMTTARLLNLLALKLVCALAMSGIATLACAQDSNFDQVAERALNRRAIEAVIWACRSQRAAHVRRGEKRLAATSTKLSIGRGQ